MAVKKRHQSVQVPVYWEDIATHRNESGDLLSVLNELYTDAFSDGRVGLLGFDTNLFQNDALGMG